MAHCDSPTRNEWVSNIKETLQNIGLNMIFEELKNTKSFVFKKIVDKKGKSAACKYLISKVKSKGKEIKFSEYLECQGYLIPNNILTVHEQRTIFLFRSKMNSIKYNLSENYKLKELCVCRGEMNYSHLYECKSLNPCERKVPYNNIFSGRLSELKYLIDILKENVLKYENYTMSQDSTLLSR